MFWCKHTNSQVALATSADGQDEDLSLDLVGSLQRQFFGINLQFMFLGNILTEPSAVVGISVVYFLAHSYSSATHLTFVNFIVLMPWAKLFLNVKSMFTGLSAPCFIFILAIGNGSSFCRFISLSPEVAFSRIKPLITFIMHSASPCLQGFGSSAI